MSSKSRKKASAATAASPAAGPATDAADPLGAGATGTGAAAGPAVGADGTTEVIVSGRPAEQPVNEAQQGPRKTGAPERPATGRIEPPLASDAQLAAGPHRPEPARQVQPSSVGWNPGDTSDVNKILDAPIKWVRVRATRDGFTGVGPAGVRRRVGDVFNVDDRFFSKSWMEIVPASTADARKTSQDIINEEHDARLGGRTRPRAADTSVVGDEG